MKRKINMIEIKQLTKVYKSGTQAVRALDGIDLEISNGMFGLLGPNGAGKTTLMRILAGIVNPTSGQVQIDGHTLSSEKEKAAVKAMLGYLPQELGLYPDLTARQFVDYMAILKGMQDAADRRQRVGKVIELVGLEQAADRKI
jgi:ABC-2 type transport system ATP-binding protein